MNKQMLEYLSCPESSESLHLKDDHLIATEGNYSYPLVNGIPWLLPNPSHSLLDWGVKLNHFQTILTNEITELNQELPKWQGTTKERLQNLCIGKQKFLDQVNKLVRPILHTKVAQKQIYDALSDIAPSTQNLLSYEANLYRDWVWGNEENELSRDLVVDLVTQPVEQMLVLGAGACRLAYDLYLSLSPKATVATDINPMLLLAANEILFGEGLEITEFPMQPRSINDTVVYHEIDKVSKKPKNFHLAFADAAKPAIRAGRCDLLVTPWLIDIQPYELTLFLHSINHYLPVGGSWINFGSLVFNQDRDAFCYSIEEINTIAQSAGFEIQQVKQQELPYLKSPFNAGYRMETVHSWRATKVKNISLPENLQQLPHWLLDTKTKIPLSDDIQQFVFSHKTYAELASYINGQYSLEQIARKFAKQNKMDQQEALAILKKFYLQMMQG